MKIAKRLQRMWVELGVGAYDVNLGRADNGQEELPVGIAALLAVWHDVRLFLAARGIGAGYFDGHYDGYWNGG